MPATFQRSIRFVPGTKTGIALGLPGEALDYALPWVQVLGGSASFGTPQIAENADGSPSAVSVTVAEGGSIYVGVTVSTNSAHTVSVSDGGDAYTELDSAVTDSTNQQQIRHWYKSNLAAGTYNVTATIGNPIVGQTFAAIVAVAINNVASNPVVAHGPGQNQAAPGSAADAITSGTAQVPTGTPCIVVSFSQDVSTGTHAPDAGSGVTSLGTGWGFGGAAAMRIQGGRLTFGIAQGTFTAQSGQGGAAYLTQMAAFLEGTLSFLATETNTPLALGLKRLASTGLASETDAALALAVTKRAATGLATETDASIARAAIKFETVGISTEADTALALAIGIIHAVATGRANETDVAVSRGWFSLRASETDAAFARAALKIAATGR